MGCGESVKEKAAKLKATAEAKVAAETKVAAEAKAIEAAIRRAANKPTGELTKADLEKVTKLVLYNNHLSEVPKEMEKLTKLRWLFLDSNQLTNLKGLENLTQLKTLSLDGNPALTKAQIDQLQKALPKCEIYSNPTK